ncbi:LysE family translocator [Tatumella saanichensis]|uniref:LysE family translocator n=1 Tax=Tatumella saanichensis TaxID=480813 RepID=UPI0004A48706|nr:LysE family translocator [Tatumella saanichensis]
MPDITSFSLFVLSVFLLSVTPGPDMAYVIGQSMANGRRAGLLSATGVALGSVTHALASTLGLTALVAASPLLFTLVKYLGAGYLIYLGSRMLLSTLRHTVNTAPDSDKIRRGTPARELLLKGYITTLTNPKVLLFFISFFPQFVTPNGSHHSQAFLILGLTYAWVAFMVDICCALLGGAAGGALAGSPRIQKVLDRIVGTTFIALGVRLALTRR